MNRSDSRFGSSYSGQHNPVFQQEVASKGRPDDAEPFTGGRYQVKRVQRVTCDLLMLPACNADPIENGFAWFGLLSELPGIWRSFRRSHYSSKSAKTGFRVMCGDVRQP